MYAIISQPVKDDEVDIKQVTKFIVEENGEKKSFKVKFPCLRVVVGAKDIEFVITWSNFYKYHSPEGAGKWKIRLMENVRPFIYMKNENGRKLNTRFPAYDYAAMAMEWGTTSGPLGWNFGANHPVERVVAHEQETENIDHFNAILEKRFGEDLAAEIMELFTSHELFQKFVAEPSEKEIEQREQLWRRAA